MKCKYCGTELPKGTKFCTNCGRDLSNLRKCVKCGEIIDDDATFCPYCGAEQPVYEEDNPHKKWLIGVVVALFIAIVGGCYYFISIRKNIQDSSNETFVANHQKDSNTLPMLQLKDLEDFSSLEIDISDMENKLEKLGYKDNTYRNVNDQENSESDKELKTYVYNMQIDKKGNPINKKSPCALVRLEKYEDDSLNVFCTTTIISSDDKVLTKIMNEAKAKGYSDNHGAYENYGITLPDGKWFSLNHIKDSREMINLYNKSFQGMHELEAY